MKKIFMILALIVLVISGVFCAAAESVSLSGAMHTYADPSWRGGKTLYTIAPGVNYTVTLGGNGGDRSAMWVLRPFHAEDDGLQSLAEGQIPNPSVEGTSFSFSYATPGMYTLILYGTNRDGVPFDCRCDISIKGWSDYAVVSGANAEMFDPQIDRVSYVIEKNKSYRVTIYGNAFRTAISWVLRDSDNTEDNIATGTVSNPWMEGTSFDFSHDQPGSYVLIVFGHTNGVNFEYRINLYITDTLAQETCAVAGEPRVGRSMCAVPNFAPMRYKWFISKSPEGPWTETTYTGAGYPITELAYQSYIRVRAYQSDTVYAESDAVKVIGSVKQELYYDEVNASVMADAPYVYNTPLLKNVVPLTKRVVLSFDYMRNADSEQAEIEVRSNSGAEKIVFSYDANGVRFYGTHLAPVLYSASLPEAGIKHTVSVLLDQDMRKVAVAHDGAIVAQNIYHSGGVSDITVRTNAGMVTLNDVRLMYVSGNNAPIIQNAKITDAPWGIFTANADIEDPDGDEMSYTYIWETAPVRVGTYTKLAETKEPYLFDAGQSLENQYVRVQITASDPQGAKGTVTTEPVMVRRQTSILQAQDYAGGGSVQTVFPLKEGKLAFVAHVSKSRDASAQITIFDENEKTLAGVAFGENTALIRYGNEEFRTVTNVPYADGESHILALFMDTEKKTFAVSVEDAVIATGLPFLKDATVPKMATVSPSGESGTLGIVKTVLMQTQQDGIFVQRKGINDENPSYLFSLPAEHNGFLVAAVYDGDRMVSVQGVKNESLFTFPMGDISASAVRLFGFDGENRLQPICDMQILKDQKDVVVPVDKIIIDLPGITQEQFDDAFRVLDECTIDSGFPVYGFIYPFMSPGGHYHGNWWIRDSVLTLSGRKWAEPEFVRNSLLNFTFVQRENGRIPLWGPDSMPGVDSEFSAIPVIFDVAGKICHSTTDRDYIEKIYIMLMRYMNWWLSSIKQDPETGLVCGIFEETDPSDHLQQLNFAEVDLNVQIAVGTTVLSEMATYLGLMDQANHWNIMFEQMKERINTYMYDPETGAYYTYIVSEKRLMKERLYNSTFDVFKRKIVPEDRVEKLLGVLKADDTFNWNSQYGITTMSHTSPEYTETRGAYKGAVSWEGNIWTLRSEIIASGLYEYGLREDCAHLLWQTVTSFAGNYAEFLAPSDGEGNGVLRYGWTASQFIELIVEYIFGISYDAWTDTITIDPCVPPELYGETLTIKGVTLGNGKKLNVEILAHDAENIDVRYTTY